MKAGVVAEDGVIFHHVKRYRRRRLITVIVLIVLLSVYAFFSRAYILNGINGASVLDVGAFSKEVETEKVPEEFKLHRSESQMIESKALKALSYWQGNSYEFDVTLSDVEQTEISYTTANTADTMIDDKIVESAIVYTASIGGVKTLVLAYPDEKLSDGDVVTGVFTDIARIVEYDIAKSDEFKTGEEICAYMLDIRGISMESQSFDFLMCVILIIFILYFSIRLLVWHLKPYSCPTYTQLEKYGEIEEIVENIESQLCESGIAKNFGKEAITENWIITKDTFKLKIVKNHLIKH